MVLRLLLLVFVGVGWAFHGSTPHARRRPVLSFVTTTTTKEEDDGGAASKKTLAATALASFLAGAVATAMYADQFVPTGLLYASLVESPSVREAGSLFENMLEAVSQGYVEEIPPSELLATAAAAMFDTMDPYSEYVAPERAPGVVESVVGRYGGVGLVVGKNDEAVVVVDAYEGYAFEKGLRPGDRLTRVGDVVVEETTPLKTVSEAIRGKPGSKVEVEFRHGWAKNEDEGEIVELDRYDVRRRELALATIFDGDLAYLRVSGFSRETAADVDASLRALEKSRGPLKGIVLDLRSNPGGLLESAVELASLFAPRGTVVVAAEGRGLPADFVDDTTTPLEAPVFYTRIVSQQKKTEEEEGPSSSSSNRRRRRFECVADAADAPFRGRPLAILVDGQSASASELVSAAVQDLDLGVVVGEKTFGKGLIQDIASLPFGAKLRLTVGEYITPSGRNLQEVDYSRSKSSSSSASASGGGGSSSSSSPRKQETRREDDDKDDERQREFRTARGRRVEQFDGVMPDVVVKPTNDLSDVEAALVLSGVYERFFDEVLVTKRPDFAATLFARSLVDAESRGQKDLGVVRAPLPPKRLLSQTDLLDLERFAVGDVTAGRLPLPKGTDLDDLRGVFKTKGDRILKLADSFLRDRFFRPSANLRLDLDDDQQLIRALNILKDPLAYDAILSPAAENPAAD